jgi:hypothetical protein
MMPDHVNHAFLFRSYLCRYTTVFESLAV